MRSIQRSTLATALLALGLVACSSGRQDPGEETPDGGSSPDGGSPDAGDNGPTSCTEQHGVFIARVMTDGDRLAVVSEAGGAHTMLTPAGQRVGFSGMASACEVIYARHSDGIGNISEFRTVWLDGTHDRLLATVTQTGIRNIGNAVVTEDGTIVIDVMDTSEPLRRGTMAIKDGVATYLGKGERAAILNGHLVYTRYDVDPNKLDARAIKLDGTGDKRIGGGVFGDRIVGIHQGHVVLMSFDAEQGTNVSFADDLQGSRLEYAGRAGAILGGRLFGWNAANQLVQLNAQLEATTYDAGQWAAPIALVDDTTLLVQSDSRGIGTLALTPGATMTVIDADTANRSLGQRRGVVGTGDARRFVYAIYLDEGNSVRSIKLDGSSRIELSDQPFAGIDGMHENGTVLLSVSTETSETFFTVPAVGGTPQQLVAPAGLTLHSPRFTKSGRIVFNAMVEETLASRLVVFDAEGVGSTLDVGGEGYAIAMID